ncbi:MAG: DUF3106 domain-containing protein [Arenicellales bacterium]|nr:DUF3106 domain-containing protein [Arenicellales bacterium]
MTKVMLCVRVLSVLTCIMVLSVQFGSPAAYAQNNLGQSWKDLSPEVRDQKRRQFFMNLPESKKQSLRESQLKFQALPVDQRRAICQKFHRQNGYYPPTCQNLLGP